MPLNTEYGLEPDVAIKGMVADSRRGTTTRTKIAKASIKPGLLITNTDDGKVELPSAQGDYIVGATLWTTTLVTEENGEAVYKGGRAVPIVTEDAIWLEAQEAIDAETLVYAVITTNKGDVKSTSGADTTTKPVGRAETATTGAGQLVRVKLMPALQGA
jgi:hypothetical protein